MGYTHYWRKGTGTVSAENKRVFKSLVVQILEDQKELLADGHGTVGTKPTWTPQDVCFNGIEDDGHETMIIHFSPSELWKFEFCKTARKPYDTAVVACLAAQALYFGKAISVSSDGDAQDFQDGFALLKKYLPQEGVDMAVKMVHAEEGSPLAELVKYLLGGTDASVSG